MGATGLMAASMGVNAISSVGTAVSQSASMRMQGDYEKNVSAINERFAGLAAEDAVSRGNIAARISEQRTKSFIGTQRADLAAQGIDVNKGSAAADQESTAAVGALDAMTIKSNAFREALGYKVQALNYSARGEFADLAARSNANSTLVTGGMRALGYGMRGAYYLSRQDGGDQDASEG